MSSKTFQGLTDGWEVIVLRTDFTLHLIFILLFLQAPHHRTLFFKHKSHNLTLLLYFTVTSSNAAVGLVHLTIRPCITTHCALPQLKSFYSFSHPAPYFIHVTPSHPSLSCDIDLTGCSDNEVMFSFHSASWLSRIPLSFLPVSPASPQRQ